MVVLKTFLSLATNAAWMSQSKCQVDFGVIFWGKKTLTFMIPVYCTTELFVL